MAPMTMMMTNSQQHPYQSSYNRDDEFPSYEANPFASVSVLSSSRQTTPMVAPQSYNATAATTGVSSSPLPSSGSSSSPPSYVAYRATHSFVGDAAAQQLTFEAGTMLMAKSNSGNSHQDQGGWVWCTKTLPGGSVQSGWCPAPYLSLDNAGAQSRPPQHAYMNENRADVSMGSQFPAAVAVAVNDTGNEDDNGFAGPALGGDFVRSSDLNAGDNVEDERQRRRQEAAAAEQERLQHDASYVRTVSVPTQRSRPAVVQAVGKPFVKTGTAVTRGVTKVGSSLVHAVLPSKDKGPVINTPSIHVVSAAQDDDRRDASSASGRGRWGLRNSNARK